MITISRGIEIWKARVPELSAQIPRLASWLAEDETLRANRYHFDSGRRTSMVSRGGLRWLLSRYLNCDPAAIRFTYSEYGRPILAFPSASEMRFSVSHSGDLVVYAFGRGFEIGIDVERMRPMKHAAGVARRFFSEREQRSFGAAGPDRQLQAFFTCWTRKEAYIKATGVGLSTPLDQFSVGVLPEEATAILEIEGSTEKASAWELHDLEMETGYAGALAVCGRGVGVSAWNPLGPDLIP